MTHQFEAGMKLVVASHNPGKVWEIKQLLAPFGVDAVSAGDLDLPEPEETEPTFVGNARLKALAAAQAAGLPALADDSGLEVDCLGGAPGIYSARWAGPQKDFALAMKKVAEEIAHRHGWAAPGPTANFVCVLCLAWPDGETEVFEGRVDGVLVWPARGGNGFGYDPMFLPDGEVETFGEMEPARKHSMSHRARAFAAFKTSKLGGLPETEGPEDGLASAGDYEALRAAAANLSSRAEFLTFLDNLRSDLVTATDEGGSAEMAAFIDRVKRWIDAQDGLDDQPVWRVLANGLLVGSRRK